MVAKAHDLDFSDGSIESLTHDPTRLRRDMANLYGGPLHLSDSGMKYSPLYSEDWSLDWLKDGRG